MAGNERPLDLAITGQINIHSLLCAKPALDLTQSRTQPGWHVYRYGNANQCHVSELPRCHEVMQRFGPKPRPDSSRHSGKPAPHVVVHSGDIWPRRFVLIFYGALISSTA